MKRIQEKCNEKALKERRLEQRRQKFEALPEAEAAAIATAFERCDFEGNGYLNPHQAAQCLKEIGLGGLNSKEWADLNQVCEVAACGRDHEAGVNIYEFAVVVVPEARQRMMDMHCHELSQVFYRHASGIGKLPHKKCLELFRSMGLDNRDMPECDEDGVSFENFEGLIHHGREQLNRVLREREWQIQMNMDLEDSVFEAFRTDLVELHELFHIYDADSSGSLSRSEIMQMLKEYGLMPKNAHDREEVEAILHSSDEDGDGEFDFREFLELVHAIRAKRRLQFRNECVQLFEYFDTDDSGSLSVPEINELMASMGLVPRSRWEQHELASLVDMADADRSGTIGLEEFQDLRQRIEEKLNRLRYETEVKFAVSIGFSELQVRDFRFVFDSLDEDGSERLDMQEIRQVVSILSKPMTFEKFTSLFNQLDEDGSGELDFFEFLEFMRLIRDREGHFSGDPQKLGNRVKYLDTQILRRALEYTHLSKGYVLSMSREDLIDLFCDTLNIKPTTNLHEHLGITTAAELFELAQKTVESNESIELDSPYR